MNFSQKITLLFSKILIFFIRIYQTFISPCLRVFNGGQGCCRYLPTCSDYYLTALERHKFLKGNYLGIKRLLRCHPWARTSGYDPLPEEKHKKVH